MCQIRVSFACLLLVFYIPPAARGQQAERSDRTEQLLAVLDAKTEDPDVFLEVWALQELGPVVSKEANVRKALFRYLLSKPAEDEGVAFFLPAQALSAAGEVAVPEIVATLAEGKAPEKICGFLALTLGRIETTDAEAVRFLSRWVASVAADSGTKVCTRIALAKLGDHSPENLAAIRASLSSHDSAAKACLAMAFCGKVEWADTSIIEALVKQVRAEDQWGAATAATVLAQGGQKCNFSITP